MRALLGTASQDTRRFMALEEAMVPFTIATATQQKMVRNPEPCTLNPEP